MATNFKRTASRFPVFGPLVYCRAEDFGSAFSESFPNVLCSLAPLVIAWLMTILFVLPIDMQNPSYIFRNGELMMAALSTIAPLFYLSQTFYPDDESPDRVQLPSRRWFLLILIFFVLTASAMYPIFQMAPRIEGLDIIKPKPQMILTVSSLMYIISVVLVFLALSYKSLVTNGNAEVFREGDEDARKEWQEVKKSWRR